MPTATSLLIDKDAPLSPMTTKLDAKVAFPTTIDKSISTKNSQLCNHIFKLMNLSIEVCQNKCCPKQKSKS